MEKLLFFFFYVVFGDISVASDLAWSALQRAKTGLTLQEADERWTLLFRAVRPSDLFLFRPLEPSWDRLAVPETAF